MLCFPLVIFAQTTVSTEDSSQSHIAHKMLTPYPVFSVASQNLSLPTNGVTLLYLDKLEFQVSHSFQPHLTSSQTSC